MSQPAGWTAPQPDVTSPLLFMHLFLSSAELSEPNTPPPPPAPLPPFVLQPYTYPLPTKAGKYSMALTSSKKRETDRFREERKTGRRGEKELRRLSHFFFSSFSSSIAPCVSSCLACKSFSCMAGRPLLAAVQLLTLLSPCKREKRRRGGQI